MNPILKILNMQPVDLAENQIHKELTDFDRERYI